MAFLPYPGHHVAAWRHFNTPADGGLDFSYYTSLAKTIKRGKLDSFPYRMARVQTSGQSAILRLSSRKSLPRLPCWVSQEKRSNAVLHVPLSSPRLWSGKFAHCVCSSGGRLRAASNECRILRSVQARQNLGHFFGSSLDCRGLP